MKIAIYVCCLLLVATQVRADWQSTLSAAFPSAKVVETFDNLQDWDSGGITGAGYDYQYCGGSGSSTLCPKNADSSQSIWQYYTNKMPTFEFTAGVGTFASGDQITGVTSGASCTIAQVWNVDSKTYIQATYDTAATASSFSPGETVQTAGAVKTGTMVAWPKYITNHGTTRVWQGTGKSLVMDLGDNDNPDTAMAGLGAQRLGTYFGTGTTTSGLAKVYIFMMTKFSSDYFGTDPYQTGLNILKFLDVASGFVSINEWGTTEERASASCNTILAEYGENSFIFNWKGGGASYPHTIFHADSPVTAYHDGTCWTYNPSYPTHENTSAAIETPYLAGEWFGIEVAVDIGTVGNSDGSMEVWIYNSSGTQIGYQQRTGMPNLVQFDHRYNKTTIGGNRRYAFDLSDRDLRYWVDDFIVDGTRIGPTYFTTLGGGSGDTTPPSTTSSVAAGRYQASQQVSLSSEIGATTQYCFGAGCTPSTSYTDPIWILKNIAQQVLRYKSIDTNSNEETVKELVFLKQRRR